MKYDDQKINQYLKTGSAPVGYKQHPKEIYRAIRAAKFEPLFKERFYNSQTLLLGQHVLDFVYVEGIVQSVIPIQHAWLELNGKVVDVTLPGRNLEVLASHTVPKEEVRKYLVGAQYYGPVREHRLNLMHACAQYHLDHTGTDQDLKARLAEIITWDNPV